MLCCAAVLDGVSALVLCGLRWPLFLSSGSSAVSSLHGELTWPASTWFGSEHRAIPGVKMRDSNLTGALDQKIIQNTMSKSSI